MERYSIQHCLRVALLGLSFVVQAGAQAVEFPQGAYVTFKELEERNPSGKNVVLEAKETKSGRYKMQAPGKDVNTDIIKNSILAYSMGDMLLLNTERLSLAGGGYVPVLDAGRYLVFKGGLSQYAGHEEKAKASSAVGVFGMMGGAIGGAIYGAASTAQANKLQFLYAYDLKTDVLVEITEASLRVLLGHDAALLSSYVSEADRDSESVQLKYLALLNEKCK